MEYNSQRNHLEIPEYGRVIQKMVEHALTIGERETRTKCAYSIVKTMADMNPGMKEVVDYKHKLWDHLYFISGFQLDVDGPFPAPNKEVLKRKPKILNYPGRKIKFKHYGKNLERMVNAVAEKETGPERSYLLRNLGSFMKNSYSKWNGNSVTDDVVNNNLKELSEGRLMLEPNMKLADTNEINRQGQLQKNPAMQFGPSSGEKEKEEQK